MVNGFDMKCRLTVIDDQTFDTGRDQVALNGIFSGGYNILHGDIVEIIFVKNTR